MLQCGNSKEMTDYDAAAALLMLSSGGRTSLGMESNNNNEDNHNTPARVNKPRQQRGQVKFSPSVTISRAATTTDMKTTKPIVPSVTLKKVEKILSEDHVLPHQRTRKPAIRVADGGEMVPSFVSESTPVEQKRDDGGKEYLPIKSIGGDRSGSSSPPELVVCWDSSRTSSPIVPGSSNGLPSPHSTLESYGELGRPQSMMYDSPGMNGFAHRLNSKGEGTTLNYAVSSPEPLEHPKDGARVSLSKKSRGSYNAPSTSTRGSCGIVEEKSLNSPTDSGVSSIHDDIILPSILIVPTWTKAAHLGEGLPSVVRTELKKILESSASNKELYTKTKMEKFPLDLGINPKKSRYRKECLNDYEKQDRERNNEASRRSRHKKKLMMHMMSISLDYDRTENRQLYLQERWLTNMIFELEEKALTLGTEVQVLRKLRANCGFQ